MTQRHAYGRASAFALALVVLASTGTLARQDRAGTPLTQQIDRVMSTRTYAVPRFGPARWVPGRAVYTTVEPAGSPDAGMDIVRYDAATGAREVIVPARLLTPAGVTRGLAIDDTIYQERYMGTPQGNAEGYRIGSPISFAERLQGRLLIVHGSGDDNVHYQGTERLVNRLIALGKPFAMMVYPNRTHAISEGEGTTAHVYQLIARYFVEHLPPGGK